MKKNILPTASQIGAPATQKSTKNMKKGALGENPEKCAKMYRNWGPRTLEIYVFMKEGLQKTHFPPSSKNHTKCLPKCHQNGAKSNKFQLRRSPRKHSKNKRRKQQNLDSKSRGGGVHERRIATLKCTWEGQGAHWAPRSRPGAPQTTPNNDFC